jgi:hypothetical protein
MECLMCLCETKSAHKISAGQPESRRTLSTVGHKYKFQIDHPQKKKKKQEFLQHFTV